MYNDLFSIGPFTIHGYGLMIGIGFIVALIVGSYRARKRGLDSDFLFNLAVLCLIFGMLGAKLLYIITVLDKIVANPSDFVSLSSGFVVYGGIIVGIFTGMVYCKIKGKVFTNYFDIVMPSISIAQGFGRIGCFLAGCCYGKETDAWYGITFTHSHYAPNNVSLIPTQLISSAGNFLIAGVLIFIARKQRKPGLIASLYLIFYGIGRFAVEMLRGDIERGNVGNLSTSQFISIFIVLIGIVYLIYVMNFSKVSESINETENAETNEDAKTESGDVETYSAAEAVTNVNAEAKTNMTAEAVTNVADEATRNETNKTETENAREQTSTDSAADNLTGDTSDNIGDITSDNTDNN